MHGPGPGAVDTGSVVEIEELAAGVADLSVTLQDEPDERRSHPATDQDKGGEDQQDDDDRDGSGHGTNRSRRARGAEAGLGRAPITIRYGPARVRPGQDRGSGRAMGIP